jgi:hypothetical protein
MITWVFVPPDLILPDQPNRAVRTRMLRDVGGGNCEAPPYPDIVRALRAMRHTHDSEATDERLRGQKTTRR